MSILEIIITIVVLGVIGLLPDSKKGKKTAPQQSAKPRPARNPRSFQPVSETSGDVVDDVWNKEYREEEYSAEPYFTYENPNMNDERDSYTEQRRTVTAPENVVMRPSVMGEEFDLRKAFIYQTILTRVEC